MYWTLQCSFKTVFAEQLIWKNRGRNDGPSLFICIFSQGTCFKRNPLGGFLRRVYRLFAFFSPPSFLLCFIFWTSKKLCIFGREQNIREVLLYPWSVCLPLQCTNSSSIFAASLTLPAFIAFHSKSKKLARRQ